MLLAFQCEVLFSLSEHLGISEHRFQNNVLSSCNWDFFFAIYSAAKLGMVLTSKQRTLTVLDRFYSKTGILVKFVGDMLVESEKAL